MTLQTETPCARCHEPHPYGRDGYYAGEGKERHPWTPGDGTTTAPRLTIGGGNPDGYEGAVFNAFWRCTTCRALLERDDTEIEAHRKFHDELVEVAAIAWRLVNERRAG